LLKNIRLEIDVNEDFVEETVFASAREKQVEQPSDRKANRNPMHVVKGNER